ncbi:MAG: hypothetical protein ABFD77_01215 [Thermotogota bacterium]
MGQLDWQDVGGSLSTATLARGVTNGIDRPPSVGPNDFVFGYNSLDGTVIGAHGKYVDLSGFKPTGTLLSDPDGGGSIRGCVKRVSSPNNTGMSPMLFFCGQGAPSVNDWIYALGLLDADPYEIVLAKTKIVTGLVEADENMQILARSSSQYAMGDGAWHHLRLDAIVEPNGDVLLKCFENDLNTHPIGTPGGPDWQNIPGFPSAGIVDDVLQILTGSPPLWGGYCGFAFQVQQALNRRGAFDALEAYRVS